MVLAFLHERPCIRCMEVAALRGRLERSEAPSRGSGGAADRCYHGRMHDDDDAHRRSREVVHLLSGGTDGIWKMFGGGGRAPFWILLLVISGALYGFYRLVMAPLS